MLILRIVLINDFFFLQRNFSPFKNFRFSPFYDLPLFSIPPQFKEFFVSLPLCPFFRIPIPPMGGTIQKHAIKTVETSN